MSLTLKIQLALACIFGFYVGQNTNIAEAVALPQPTEVQQSIPALNTNSRAGQIHGIDLYFNDLGAEVWDQAYTVAECESSLNPQAHRSDIGRLGSGDHGLFQINHVHQDKLDRLGYSWSDMFDPVKNAKIARQVFDEDRARGGSGWGPWFMTEKCHGLT